MVFTPILREERLSESILWEQQKEAYAQFGPESWSQRGVPFQITSNPLIARQYAEVALSYLQVEPVSFLEVGGGSGKFAYLFLQELLPRAAALGLPPVRYVLTDCAEKNIAFWKKHPLLLPYLEQGILETAVYDPLAAPFHRENKQLLFVVANYFFDSIQQDLFRVERGQLFEGRITLHRKGEGTYSYHPVDRADYYPDFPVLNEILDDYRRQISDATFLLPIGAFRSLQNLGSCFVLSADKGFSSLEQVITSRTPSLVYQGTVSFPVNFHAMGEYIRKTGGKILSPRFPRPIFSVKGFYSEPTLHPKVRETFDEQFNAFGPQDLFEQWELLKKSELTVKQLLPFLRLSNWDSTLLLEKIELLEQASEPEQDEVCHALEQAKRRFFPLSDEECLLGYNFDFLLQKFGRRADLHTFRMLERQRSDIEEFIKKAKPFGDILQIGTMPGVREAIQAHHPKSYKVVPAVVEKLKPLKTFDTIFIFMPQTRSKRPKQFSSLIVRQVQKVVEEIEQKYSQLKEMTYTDTDLDQFFLAHDLKATGEATHYLRFFAELEKKKNITREQLQSIFDRLIREGIVERAVLEQFFVEYPFVDDQAEHLFYKIVWDCFKNRMKRGSTLCGYLQEETSLSEDKQFFDEIIANPAIDYSEEVQSISGRDVLWVKMNKIS